MEILIYDEIRDGAAVALVNRLRGMREVTVRINSPGGHVGEGLAIFNALRAHGHGVTTIIDGFALSIASVIAMAGRRVLMAENAMLMIHDPWMNVTGNAADLERNAGALDRLAGAMVGAYTRSGMSPAKIRELMRAETWLNAEEALKAGFVDQVIEAIPIAASFDLSRFSNVPAEVQNMTKEVQGSSATEAAAASVAAAAQVARDAIHAAKAEEKQRVDGINAAVDLGKRLFRGCDVLASAAVSGLRLTEGQFNAALEALRRDLLGTPTAGPDAAGAAVRSLVMGLQLGNDCDAIGGHYVAGEFDNTREPGRMPRGSFSGRTADFVEAATDALLARAGLRVAKPHPGARDMAHMSVLAMAEAIGSQAGIRMGDRSPNAIIRAAHTTSDFPLLLSNTASKALMLGYENEPASHRMWVRQVDVNDFKEQQRVARSEAPALLEIAEAGEYKHGSFGERKEAYQLATYGRIFKITRQAIVNDDLGAFTDLPAAFGAAAARLEADKVYGILTGNPQMSDGAALFHATHGNLAGTGAILGVASLGAARAAMRKQQGLQQLGYLNIVPRYLIVPAALETAAESLLASITRPDAQASGVSNPEWIRSLSLVVDARLDADSETAWYLAAGTGQVDTVEVAYLAGQRGVFTEEDSDFDTDAFKIKARLDFQAAAIDWRGLYKNPGANP